MKIASGVSALNVLEWLLIQGEKVMDANLHKRIINNGNKGALRENNLRGGPEKNT